MKEEVGGNYITLCHSIVIGMNFLIEILMVKNYSGFVFNQVVTSYTGKVPKSNRYLVSQNINKVGYSKGGGHGQAGQAMA